MEHRQPLYLDEVEALVGQFTHSSEAAKTLHYEGVEQFDHQEVDMAYPIYLGALRILARQRFSERPKLDNTARRQWNESWLATLTISRLASITQNYTEELSPLRQAGRELRSFSHTLMRLQSSSNEDSPEGLRPDQQQYMKGITDFFRQPAQEVIGDDGKAYKVHGTLVDAPTGSGKSALAGTTAMAANIGPNNPLLIVVPNVELAQQFSGQIGDDTFRRFAPDGLTVGSFHATAKETNTDVVVTTIHQFVTHSKNGTFLNRPYGMIIVDEAHTITQPLFKKAFLEEWCGSSENKRNPTPTVGFTATAAYNPQKNAADVLPNIVQHADLLSHMQNGILNAGQFFLVNVEAFYSELAESVLDNNRKLDPQAAGYLRQEAIRQCMADFFTPLIEEGRRGIVFLEAGGVAENARELAALFRKIRLSDGQYITAEALHSQPDKSKGEKSSDQILTDYNEGKIQVITSVGMGGQGLNAAFDFVGVSHVDSLLKLRQILGRGTRRSLAFPTTIYAQFLLPSIVAGHGRGKLYRTFYEALGLDTIEQGLVIGRQQYYGGQRRTSLPDMRIAKIIDFPKNIRRLLDHVDGRIIGQLAIGAENKTEIPPDYISFDDIYAKVADRMSVASARYRLEVAGYKWLGIITKEASRQVLKRYYEPGSEIVLDPRRIPPRKETDQHSYDDLERELGVSRNFLEGIYRNSLRHKGVIPLRRLAKNGHVTTTFTEDHKEAFKKEIDDIPSADETDISVLALAKQLGVAHEVVSNYADELGVHLVYKRKLWSKKPGKKGFGWFMSRAERQLIEDRATAHPWATSDEWPASRIAEAAGIGNGTLYGRLTQDDHTKAFIRRVKTKQGTTREILHWKQHDALQLVAQFKNAYQLPAHLIPYFVVRKIAKVPRSVPTIIDTNTLSRIKLPGCQAVVSIRWEDLRTLQEEFGTIDQDFSIDFNRLPKDENDHDPARHTYARYIQLQFMSARRMGNPGGIID